MAHADDHWCEGGTTTRLSITSGTVSVDTHVDVNNLVIVNDDTRTSGSLYLSIFASETRRSGDNLGGLQGYHLLDVEHHPNRDGLWQLTWITNREPIQLLPGRSTRITLTNASLREPAAGTYWLYALVYEWNSSLPENGAHCFQAGWAFDGRATFGGATDDDHGDTLSTATRVALPSETAGVIDPGTDTDWFRFEVPASGELTAETTGSLDAVGTLYDADGNVLASNDDSGVGLNFRIQHELAAGTYFLRVASFFGSDTGSYVLRLRFEASDDDHGDSASSATRVALPSETVGVIDPGTDTDWFRFEVPASGELTAETTGNLDTVGTLYDADGNVLASNDDSGVRRNFRIQRELAAGTYFLRVASFRSNTGSYVLQLRTDNPGTPIRDFPVGIPSNCSREVQICVRDHECEDGDEVRVTVNGDVVFEGELFNRQQCRDVAVREGDNPIEMLALNGTGFKGACSHQDVNTGEITVTSPGGNQTLQSWRHRGGAGSTANLVVTIGAAADSCAFDPSSPSDEGGTDQAGTGAGHLRNLGDFDGDGKDDVLLRHTDGRWHFYPMDGRRVLAGSGAANLTRDLAWQVAGIGDFNGDGRADVLLRRTDGRWYFYPMNGRTALPGRGTVSMTQDLAWRVVGIADFDGDGRDDVLLRHENGRWHYYRMNGRRPLSGSGRASLTVNLAWQTAGVGDFDGDGRADVLLRHEDGRWYFYPMNGRAALPGRGGVGLTQDLAWAVAGVGDFDADGRHDVLLRHEDGRWRYHPLSGRTVRAGGGAANLTGDTTMFVVGIGDMNGDGRADVLMRRANGSWHYYPMRGRSVILGHGEASLSQGLGWSVAGQPQRVPNAPVPNQGVEVAGTVVNYFTGDAIPSAVVRLTQYHNGSSRDLGSSSSGADGSYSTRVPAIRPGRVTVRASAAGFAPQSEVLELASSLDQASVTLRLLPVQVEARFQSGDDATVSVEGQGVLDLPAHSLVDPRGAAVTGQVTARVTVLDASGDPGVMPGDFSTMGQDDAPMPIESFGAVNLELVNSAGEPLGLSAGALATVSVPLADRRRPQAGPNSVPMYYWSDEMGRWIEDGEATLRETSPGQWAYVGSVNQLRTWNADLAFATTTLAGCVTDSNGNAAVSARVESIGVDYIGRSETRTDNQGRFELSVRPDSRVLLTADAGSHSSTLTVQTMRGVTLSDCLTVSPAAATIRLTWGTNPSDLDSHLWGPTDDGGTFHVYFGNRSVRTSDATFELDVDDTSSFGPEIITISSFPIAGTYQYMVYHYSGTGSISDSPARVELNVGGTVTIFSPSGASGQETRVWSVFEIEVDSNLVPEVVAVQRFVDRLAPASGSPGPEARADRRGREGDRSRSRAPNPMSVLVERKYYK